jgi:cholest-4-en-3-one 26-monooxygenase
MSRPDAVDLADPRSFAEGPPHEAFARLRREAPVSFQPERGGPGYWAVVRHADVVRVSKDPETFSSARGTNIFDPPAEDLPLVQSILINMDPPRHARFRRLVKAGFTPRRVAGMERRTRAVARRILDAVAHKGECDFVRDVAAELPLRVIAELLGVPFEDRHRLFELSNRLILGASASPQAMADSKAAAMEMWLYAHELAARRRERPGDDLVSRLLAAEVDGERLTEMEFDSFFLLLAVAGNETTRNLISGGMLALLEHPAALAALRADRRLLPDAVEELLRWVTPIVHMRRTASCEVELCGQRVRAGEKVVLFYTSANRDEAVFAEPFRFEIRRRPNRHLAFGVGEHFCLGSHLARLEARVLFEEALRRLPDLRLAGRARRLESSFVNGLVSMPVRFTPTD